MSFPPFSSNNEKQYTVSVSGNRLPHRTPTKCFWHANGELNCKNSQVLPNSESPETHLHFHSFGVPNQNYKPNAYHQQENEISNHGTPCCSVPCNGCSAHVNSHFDSPQSMPRQPTDQNAVRGVHRNVSHTIAPHSLGGHNAAGQHHTTRQSGVSQSETASHAGGQNGVHNDSEYGTGNVPMHHTVQTDYTSVNNPYTGAGSDHLSS